MRAGPDTPAGSPTRHRGRPKRQRRKINIILYIIIYNK